MHQHLLAFFLERRALAVVAFLVFANIVPAGDVDAQMIDAWKVTTRTTIDSSDGHPTHAVTLRMLLAGNRTRTEFDMGRGMPGGGMYTLSDETTGTTTAVMPGQKIKMTSKGMGGLPSAGMAVSAKLVGNPTLKSEDLGAGEAILGYPTRHMRVTQRVVIALTMAGETCTKGVNSVSDVWATDRADIPAAIRRHMFFPFGMMAGASTSDSTFVNFQERYRNMIKGVPLRVTSTTERRKSTGAAGTTMATMEVTELAKVRADSSAFTAPIDFKSVDIDIGAARARLDTGRMNRAIRTGLHTQCDPDGKS